MIRMNIFVSSPKSYKDIFDIFYLCYKKNWSNSLYPLVLSTNYVTKYDGVQVYSSNNENDSWVERSIPVLRSLSCKYVMMVCDDIFFKEQVDNTVVEHILDVMDKYNINFCRFQPLRNGQTINGESYLSWSPKRTPYVINLLRGIYNREYLLSLLGDGSKSIWELEGEWLKKTAFENKGYHSNLITCNREVMPIIHGVMKRKFMPSSVRRLRKIGIKINSNREVMPWYKEFYFDCYSHLGYILSPSARHMLKIIAGYIGLKTTNNY